MDSYRTVMRTIRMMLDNNKQPVMYRLVWQYLKVAVVVFLFGFLYYCTKHTLLMDTNSFKAFDSGLSQRSRSLNMNFSLIGNHRNYTNHAKYTNHPNHPNHTNHPNHANHPHDLLFPMRDPFKIQTNIFGLRKHILYEPLQQLLEIRQQTKGIDFKSDWLYPGREDPRILLERKSHWFTEVEKLSHTIGAVHVNAPIELLLLYIDAHIYNQTDVNCTFTENNFDMTKRDSNYTSCFGEFVSAFQPNVLRGDDMLCGFPKEHRHPAGQLSLTYLHVLKEATVSENGDVYVGNTKIVGHRCPTDSKEKYSLHFPSIMQQNMSLIYDEVYSISQYWGFAYFHLLVENIPRLPSFLTFLLDNPSIKIHIFAEHRTYINPIFEHIGLSEDRLISGMIRAKVLYLPQSVPCGGTLIFNSRLQSMIQRSFMQTAPVKRRTILLIKRSEKRFFRNHEQILQALTTYCEEELGGLYHVEVFSDNPLPTLEVTMAMFSSAFMVIGPHGAGESNLLYSEPGTIMIEGLCHPPNWCFKSFMRAIGHRYHGIYKQGKSCFNLTSEDILEPVRTFINVINSATKK